MAPLAFALVLLSALLHAAWNAGLKRARNLTATTLTALGVAVGASALTALFSSGPVFPTRASLGWTLLSGLLEGGYVLCLIRLLSGAPLGWVYAWMRGSAVLMVWPVSLVFQGEPLRLGSLAGAALATLGLGLTGSRPHGDTSKAAVLWALLAGVCIAGYNLCYKGALAQGASAPAVFTVSLSLGLGLQVLLLYRQRRMPSPGELAAQPLLATVSGLGCAASFLLCLYALRTEGAAAVTTLRNTSVVFAQVLALGLGERPTSRQWMGALCILAGAALLGWAR